MVERRVETQPTTALRAPLPIAFLGGTFDPVHYGHLRFAAEVKTLLDFPELRLVPAARPRHRDRPQASAEDRLAMVRLAVREFPGLGVDDREVRRAGPSYTVLTLEDLRREIGDAAPLVWLLGADAFLGLPTWHRWRELFDLTHFLVTARPEHPLQEAMPPQLQEEWERRQVVDRRMLSSQPAGAILVERVTPQPISASEVRQRLASGSSVRGLLPDSVIDYIRSHRLYQAA